jgi:hypothetical protein
MPGLVGQQGRPRPLGEGEPPSYKGDLLDPNSAVLCYVVGLSTTASPQPLSPSAAGEVSFSMYFCPFLPVGCVRKQTIS